MLFFRSEEGVNNWCEQNQMPRGEVLSLEQVWELSKIWYHTRLNPDYRGRTLEEVQTIFRQLGLHSDFWLS